MMRGGYTCIVCGFEGIIGTDVQEDLKCPRCMERICGVCHEEFRMLHEAVQQCRCGTRMVVKK